MLTKTKNTHPLRNGIAIAGVRGGMGKTFVTLGLIRSLVRKGHCVAPFKKGPDYIDPAWLSLAAGRYCHNLDTFLMDEDTTRSIYLSSNSDARLCVIEGNRGLYDGYNVDGSHSLAELAKLLDIPVIIVVECTKTSRTVAAVVLGVKMFDPELKISGVVLNHVAGERHRSVLTAAIEKYTGLPVLGAVPRVSGELFHERQKGLLSVDEHESPEKLIDRLGDIIEHSVDIERIIEISGAASPSKTRLSRPSNQKSNEHRVFPDSDGDGTLRYTGPTIGVLHDSAFNFYYKENIEALIQAGGSVVEISPLSQTSLPEIDALYISGGLTETYAGILSANGAFNEFLRERIEDGLPVYAENGGLVYLSNSILHEGVLYPMLGVFPMVFETSAMPQGHGYSIFEVDSDNPFYETKSIIKGHQFHYIRVVNNSELEALPTAFRVRRGTGIIGNKDGALYKNVLATFSHTHTATHNVCWPQKLVSLADSIRNSQNPAGLISGADL